MFRSFFASAVVLLAATTAQAQSYQNPNLPRSPYALPVPRDAGPDADELINGNGKLHFSGQWRHWGDSRNGGELAYYFFAPNGVAGGGPAVGPDRRYR